MCLSFFLRFFKVLDEDISNYATKVNLVEMTASKADVKEAKKLADSLNGDWMASTGISYEGETVTLEIYSATHDKIRFVNDKNELIKLGDDGVYLCQRLKNTAKIGDIIEFSPYGSDETYKVKVAGYFRSLMTECIVMTDSYADSIDLPYQPGTIYTDKKAGEIENMELLLAAGIQDKETVMDTYDGFMDILNIMVMIFVIGAIVLGIVVLYNLGVMSYVERYRELATLKVLGFNDKKTAGLLISQNIWLTVAGVLIGLPGGVGVLYALIKTLASEYELSLSLGVLTYSVSILVTFGVSTFVGFMVARKNKNIDMVEALKGAE